GAGRLSRRLRHPRRIVRGAEPRADPQDAARADRLLRSRLLDPAGQFRDAGRGEDDQPGGLRAPALLRRRRSDMERTGRSRADDTVVGWEKTRNAFPARRVTRGQKSVPTSSAVVEAGDRRTGDVGATRDERSGQRIFGEEIGSPAGAKAGHV